MLGITQDELDSMPLPELVGRMDEFLITAQLERYGRLPFIFPLDLPSDIYNTLAIRDRAGNDIRRIVYLAFSYLIELELHSASGGFANKTLYTDTHKPSDWSSPAFQIRYASLKQYEIISSRIAFEVFIELLYLIETGNLIKTDKRNSKISPFKKWLFDTNNKFHYFAHILLRAYTFDRELRSPEVHGTSRLPKKMLLLQMPSNEESNESLGLFNTLLQVWRPLIDILNGIRPTYIHTLTPEEDEWWETYMSKDQKAIEAKLKEMFDSK